MVFSFSGFLPLWKSLGKTDLLFSSLAPMQGPCTAAAGRRPGFQELAWAGSELGACPYSASQSRSSTLVADLYLEDC